MAEGRREVTSVKREHRKLTRADLQAACVSRELVVRRVRGRRIQIPKKESEAA